MTGRLTSASMARISAICISQVGLTGIRVTLSVFIMLPHTRAEQAILLLMIMAVIETNPAQLTCCYWTYRVNRAQNWLVGSTDMSRPPQVRPDVRPVDGSTVVL
jgi:hypothetical protein